MAACSPFGMSLEKMFGATPVRQGAVGVRGGHGEPIARDPRPGGQASGDLLDDGVGDAQVVDRDEHPRALGVGTDRQRLGPDALCDADRFLRAEAIAVQPDGIIRGDVHSGEPELHLLPPGRRRNTRRADDG